MPGFSIRNPYFIVVVCLALLVIGVTSLARMPVDLFPPINLPEVVVATFYSGMPPQDIETDITDPLERFFTLASGIDHMESRSLLGVSVIRVYFQPGTNADADVTELSNLALADLKRLPPGTLPPVVLKFDASSLPVALVTVKGQGLNETQLHDYAQFQIRNQIAVVPGAEIPPPFGGNYRQIMVYVDPYKLLSRQLSPMDVVDAVNNSNLILPAGDVKIGLDDYYVYSNSLVDNMKQLNDVPIKTVGSSWVSVNDVGKAEDSHQIQYNVEIKAPNSYGPDRLEDISVGQVMKTDHIIIGEEKTIAEARDILNVENARGTDYFIVAGKDGDYRGIVNSSDIFNYHHQPDRFIKAITKSQKNFVIVQDSLKAAIELMAREGIDLLLVISGDSKTIVGVLSHREVIATYTLAMEEQEKKEAYISIKNQGLKIMSYSKKMASSIMPKRDS